jgi:hypothetical protein
MIPKTILFSDQLNGSIPVSVTLSGNLTTAIQLTGTITINVTPSGPLTTSILMVSTIPITLALGGPLFAAKKAGALKQCGHPMFTKCSRSHLGEE